MAVVADKRYKEEKKIEKIGFGGVMSYSFLPSSVTRLCNTHAHTHARGRLPVFNIDFKHVYYFISFESHSISFCLSLSFHGSLSPFPLTRRLSYAYNNV